MRSANLAADDPSVLIVVEHFQCNRITAKLVDRSAGGEPERLVQLIQVVQILDRVDTQLIRSAIVDEGELSFFDAKHAQDLLRIAEIMLDYPREIKSVP